MKDDGGSAFPVPSDDSRLQGMSLRDYFAAKAMQGFASNPTFVEIIDYAYVAKHSYKWADAMLKERNK